MVHWLSCLDSYWLNRSTAPHLTNGASNFASQSATFSIPFLQVSLRSPMLLNNNNQSDAFNQLLDTIYQSSICLTPVHWKTSQLPCPANSQLCWLYAANMALRWANHVKLPCTCVFLHRMKSQYLITNLVCKTSVCTLRHTYDRRQIVYSVYTNIETNLLAL